MVYVNEHVAIIQLQNTIRFTKRNFQDRRLADIRYVKMDLSLAKTYYERYGTKRLVERCVDRNLCDLCSWKRDPYITPGDLIWIYELKQTIPIENLPDTIHTGNAEGLVTPCGVVPLELTVTNFSFAYQCPMGEVFDEKNEFRF